MKRFFIASLLILLMIGSVNADTLILSVTEDSQTGRVISYPGNTFADIRAGGGIASGFNRTSLTIGEKLIPTESTKYGTMSRGLMSWNLNGQFDDGDTITGAKLVLWGSSKDTTNYFIATVGITNATPNNPLTHVYTDYNTYVNIMMSSGNITRASWSTTTMDNFTINANGISYMQSNINGNISFMHRSLFDINNAYSGTYDNWNEGSSILLYSKDNGNSTRIPSLEIDYTPAAGGDTTPPESIYNITNTTTCNSINWTWENSTVSTDFNHTMLYKDNTLIINASNTTHYYLFEGLEGWKTFEFSTRTVDTTGNVNTTWVNQTTTTSPICILDILFRQYFHVMRYLT